MKLNRMLLKALVGLTALHVAFNFLLTSYFPDHVLPTNYDKHPMIQSIVHVPQKMERMLEMKHQQSEPNNNLDEATAVNQGGGGHQQLTTVRTRRRTTQRNNRSNKLALLQNEKSTKVPTANTISPYLKHPLFQGKERLLTMLHEAHYFNDSAAEFFQDDTKVEALTSKLPTWETITERLGGDDGPQIQGLETCQAFQQQVPLTERFLGVAGLFATGTNLLASLLVANCENKARIQKYHGGTGVRWQVNWGKHSPARYRLINKIDPRLHNENYLPVVTIRHPYSWMQSMCRQRYSCHWFHNSQAHCPNLVPNDIDHYWYNYTIQHGKRGINRLYKDPWLRDNLLDLANYTYDSTHFPVRVRYKSGTHFHGSLVHFWNEWYQEYMEADFPRIVVRLEDLVFHAKEVVTKVCSCIGGTVTENFQYVTETAKVGDDNIHGVASQRTNLIKWFTKWHLEDRIKNMTTDDRSFAQKHLDPKLLEMFRYSHPQPNENPYY